MSYSTAQMILDRIPEKQLIQITDDKKLGVVDQAIVTASQATAYGLVNGYCGVKYSVPFATVPALIPELEADIAAYLLYKRKVDVIPEAKQKSYDDAIAFLKDVSRGTASLGIDPAPAAPTVGAPESNKTTNDRVFTRDKLNGF